MLEKYLEINPEVKNALENNIPVVALESTIISHGMPYPQNAETALKVESIVRENGGIPATIFCRLCLQTSHMKSCLPALSGHSPKALQTQPLLPQPFR